MLYFVSHCWLRANMPQPRCKIGTNRKFRLELEVGKDLATLTRACTACGTLARVPQLTPYKPGPTP